MGGKRKEGDGDDGDAAPNSLTTHTFSLSRLPPFDDDDGGRGARGQGQDNSVLPDRKRRRRRIQQKAKRAP